MPKLEDLDLDGGRLDDRWTASKLYAAGYTPEWERTCRTCGEEIEAWRRADGRILVLDATVLTPHSCER